MPSTSEAHRIGWAVAQAKAGRAVTRAGWKVPGQRITLASGTGRAKPYLLWHTRSNRTWPATLGQQDLLAEDWKLA